MNPLDPGFFDYTCDRCGQPVCERQQLMSLSLGHEDTLFCLSCLAREEGLPVDTVRITTRRYIAGRDCFRKPWASFAAAACAKVSTGDCPCQDDPAGGWTKREEAGS